MRGNSGQGPLKLLDEKGLESGGRRWRFAKLNDRLRSTSARPTALPSADYAANLDGVAPEDTTFSHFTTTLNSRADSDKTATFTSFSASVRPLSLSLPLIFRNRKRIIDHCADALKESTQSDGEATASITLCISALCQDMGPENFHPLLPTVVIAFADALQTHHPKESETPEKLQRKSGPTSTFWDPHVALIPIFAALAELTKALLQPLAANPESTLQCLTPLFSSSRSRVREMTAESSLGYLIRKTRDASVRNRFVALLVEGLPDAELPPQVREHLTDGLGACLYESIRLPSGQLHSRAIDVLKIAVSNIPASDAKSRAESDTEHTETPKTGLKIVARCFASLCRYLTNGFDVQKVTLILAMEGERAVKSKDILQLGNMLFLIRNWFAFGGMKFYSLLGEPACQKFLNFISGTVRAFKHETRIVGEAVSAICSLYRNAHEVFRRKSVWPAILSCLDSVSSSDHIEAMTLSLRIVFESRAIEWQRVDLKPVVIRVSKISERISMMSEKTGTGDGVGLCKQSMWGTLKFFSLVTGSSFRPPKALLSYKVPRLSSKTQSILDNYVKANAKAKSTEALPDDVREVLDLWAVVIVPEGPATLNQLLSLRTWDLDDRAYLLMAAMRQASAKTKKGEELLRKAINLLRLTLSSEANALNSALMCAAAEKVIKCSEDATLLFQENGNVDDDLVASVKSTLTENLSSRDADLRKASLSLYISLTPHNDLEDSAYEDSEQHVAGLEESLKQLRTSFTEDVSIPGILSVLSGLNKVSQSLESITSALRIVQEVNKLVQQRSSAFSEEVHHLLYHFTIGLYRTPLKPLWQHAGELLISLAAKDSKATMVLTLSHLNEAAGIMINAAKNRQEDKGNDLDEPPESDDDDDDDETDDTGGEKKNPRQAKGITEQERPTPSKNQSGKRPRDGHKGGRSTKRQRTNEKQRGVPVWNVDSLPLRYLTPLRPVNRVNVEFQGAEDKRVHGTADTPTFLVELVNALGKEPKHTVHFRSEILHLYLLLDPSYFSRRIANMVVSSLASLIEKMGGLKCCGSDAEMEAKMRARLLSDLGRPGSQLQSSTLRCLCVSRSAPIKSVRDSLLRLLKDSSFREELTLLTDRQLSQSGEVVETDLTEEQQMVADVMIRICISKMKGTNGSLDSRRGAALSFITSKLPKEFALSKTTDMLLESVIPCIAAMEECEFVEPLEEDLVPRLRVLKAILGSVETITKISKRSLPTGSWRKLTITGLLALQNAGVGSVGQHMRSKALKTLASMHHIRPEETLFIVPHVFRCVKSSTLENLGADSIVGSPALLVFIEEVCRDDGLAVCLEHTWPITFCAQVLRAQNADTKALCSALTVAKCLSEFKSSVDEMEVKGHESISSRLFEMNESLCKLIPKLVNRMDESKHNQKVWGTAFEHALEVTETSLAHAAFDEADASEVIKALFLFLQKPRLSAVSPASSLKTLKALFQGMDNSTNEQENADYVKRKQKLVYDMIPMLSARRFVKDDLAFQALCALLSTIGTPDLRAAMKLVEGTNAMQKNRLGSPDLDQRVDSLNIILRNFKQASLPEDGTTENSVRGLTLPLPDEPDTSIEVFSPTVLLALCHGCIGAVYSEDTAIRGIAGFCLRQLGHWTTLSTLPFAKGSWADILTVLLQGTTASKRIIIRREFCLALGEIVRCSVDSVEESKADDGSSYHLLLRELISDDPETDFFENIVHLQPHRRSRALRLLEKYLSQNTNDTEDENKAKQMVSLASKFALPIACNIALEPLDRENLTRHYRLRNQPNSREDMVKDVTQWAVSLTGAVCKLLDWKEYTSTLDLILRNLERNNAEEDDEVPFKLLVKITESFPHPEESRAPPTDVSTTYLIDRLLPRMLKHISSGAIENNLLHHSEKVSNVLTKGKGEVKFRAPVALAVARLLHYISDDRQETLVPLLVTPLITTLRSKIVSVREASKKALVSVMMVLGTRYLSKILRQIFLSLKDGFRKDVIVLFLHALLSTIRDMKKQDTGADEQLCIDSCVDDIVPHIIEELRSGISEVRREYHDPNATDARIKAAAARTSKAYACTELLGEIVSFSLCGSPLSLPFLTTHSKSTSPKLIGRMGEAIRRMLMGISRNSSLEVENAIIFCHKLFSVEDLVLKAGENDVKIFVGKGFQQLKRPLATSFGLRLLHIIVSKNVEVINSVNEDGIRIRALCQPFPDHIVEALNKRDDHLTTHALRLAQRLVAIHLKNKGEFIDRMCDAVTEVLSESASRISYRPDNEGTHDLFNTSLRAAAVMYKEATDAKGSSIISNDKVEVLMSIAKNCLENGGGETLSATLALIRSVVVSKVVHPSVYDIVEDVRKFAVVTQSTSLRSTCASLITRFLTTFVTRPKLLKQYLEFFVRNLNYERPSGRLTAIESIHELISKVKDQQIESHSQYLLIALAASLSRETDSQCRDGAFAAVRALFSRMQQGRPTTELLKIGATLAGVQHSMSATNEEPMSVQTSSPGVAQSGAVVLAAACKSGSLTSVQLGLVVRVCTYALQQVPDDSDEWQTVHSLLQCLEAAFETQSENTKLSARLELLPASAELWEAVPTLLLHRHQWVRLLTGNLLGRHLSAAGGRKTNPTGLGHVWSIWTNAGLPRETLRSSCLQLEADHLSGELAQQCLKNIACMADVIQQHPHAGDSADTIVNGAGGDDDDDDVEGAIISEGAETGDSESDGKQDANRCLRWLLSRMNGIACKTGGEEHDILRRGCALRFFLITTKWWGGAIVLQFLALYVGPVMKVLESGDISTDIVPEATQKRRRRRSSFKSKRDSGRDKEKGNRTGEGENGEEQPLGKQALRSICETLQSALIEAVGAESYYTQYRVLQSGRTKMKQEKKQREALMAAIDPEREAKRRRRRTEVKREKRRSLKGNVRKRRNELSRTSMKRESLTSDL